GPHRQRLADRLAGLFRAHGQDGHLALVGLGLAQALLDRVLIQFVDDPIDGCAVEPCVLFAQGALGPRVGDLLDADADVQQRWPTSCLSSPALPDRARLRLPNPAVGPGSGVPAAAGPNYPGIPARTGVHPLAARPGSHYVTR